MQRQEINLYHYIEDTQTDTSAITINVLYIVCLLFTLLTLVIYAVTLWNIKSQNEERVRLTNKSETMKKTFFKLKEDYPSLFFSSDVQGALTILGEQIKQQQKIIQSLADNNPFSVYLTAFAESIPNGIWLTSITIENSGDQITLKGQNSNKLALQQFIEKSQSNSLLSKFKIQAQEIGNMSQSGNDKHLEFNVVMVKNHE